MRPGRWRRFVVRPLLWGLALGALTVAGALLTLRTDFARERVRAAIARTLSERIDRPVLIARAEFDLFPFALRLSDVVIPGDRPLAPAFLRVRELVIEADVSGVGAPVVELTRVAARGVDVTVERRQDGDNIPRLRSSGSGRRTLTVKIGGLSVDDARVTVAERTLPLRLEAREVLARFAGIDGTDLEGNVVAQEVSAFLPGARPAGLAVGAKVRVLRDRVEISNARISAPDLSVRASGQVRWQGGTAVDLTCAVDSGGGFLDRLGYLDGQIRGPFSAEGTVSWRERRLGWRARVRSPRLEIVGFEVLELEGVASGGTGEARFELERGRFADGRVAGSFGVEIAPPRYPARLEVGLDDADLDLLLDRFEVPLAGFASRADGRLLYAFDLGERGTGQGSGDLVLRASGDRAGRIPAVGTVPVRIVDDVVELPGFELSMPGQEVMGSLRYAPATRLGRLEARVESRELGVLAGLLPALEPGAAWTPTTGTGELRVGAHLAPEGARVELGLDLRDVETAATAAEQVTGRVALGATAVEEIDLELTSGGARLALEGRVPFDSAEPGLALDLLAESWPLADARPWLPFELPLDGPVQGRLGLTGSVERLAGTLLARVEPVRFPGLDAERLDVELRWDPERAWIERAALVTAAGEIAGAGRFGFEGSALDLRLESDGLDLSGSPFDELIPAGLAGSLGFAATVSGTLDAPEVEVDGGIEGLRLEGRELDPGASTFRASLHGGDLRLEATVPGLATVTGAGRYEADGSSSAELAVDSERLGRLVELGTGVAVEGLTGSLAASVAVSSAPGQPLEAAIVIPSLEFVLDGHSIRSLEPVRARVDAGGLRLDSLFLGTPGSDDSLFVAGRIGLGGDGPLDLDVEAGLAALWLAPLVGDLDLDGRLEGLAHVQGTLDRPEVNGQVAWVDGRFVPPVVPHSLESLRALVLLYPDLVVLDRLDAGFAGGTIAAKGRVELPTDERELDYRFELTARQVAPRWPAGWQLRGDADLVFASSEGGRSLRGEVDLERAWYLRDLELSPTQLIQRLLARSRVEVATTDERLTTTALQIAVRGEDSVRVRNNVARLGGDLDLVVLGTLARPVVFGEISIDEGGTATYGGNTYAVERGRVTFSNPLRIVPVLDVAARSRVDQYDVTLNLSGPLERLNTTFSSDPPLPDLDIVSLIATGTTSRSSTFSEVAAAPGAAEALSAEALLYGQAASLLTERVGRLFGLDQVRVQPLTSGDTISEARVTVGKRLSSKLYVTYSVDPSSTAQQILQVEWRIDRNLVLVLTQNGNDSYAVDARWERRF